MSSMKANCGLPEGGGFVVVPPDGAPVGAVASIDEAPSGSPAIFSRSAIRASLAASDPLIATHAPPAESAATATSATASTQMGTVDAKNPRRAPDRGAPLPLAADLGVVSGPWASLT
jgi:hypothetical protein